MAFDITEPFKKAGKLGRSDRHELTDLARHGEDANLYMADSVIQHIQSLYAIKPGDTEEQEQQKIQQFRQEVDQAQKQFGNDLLAVQRRDINDPSTHPDKRKIVDPTGMTADDALGSLLHQNRGIAIARGNDTNAADFLRSKMDVFKKERVGAIGVELPKDFQPLMDGLATMPAGAARNAAFDSKMTTYLQQRETYLKKMETSGNTIYAESARQQRQVNLEGIVAEARVANENGLRVVCMASPVERQTHQRFAMSRGNSAFELAETNGDYVSSLHSAQNTLRGYEKIVVVAHPRHLDAEHGGYVGRSMNFASVSINGGTHPNGRTVREPSGIDYNLSNENGSETLKRTTERNVEVRRATAIHPDYQNPTTLPKQNHPPHHTRGQAELSPK